MTKINNLVEKYKRLQKQSELINSDQVDEIEHQKEKVIREIDISNKYRQSQKVINKINNINKENNENSNNSNDNDENNDSNNGN